LTRLSSQNKYSGSLAEQDKNPHSQRKVLIVDDESFIRQMLSLILTNEGYCVLEAENGQDALEKLKNAEVEVIITDLRMPLMNGIEFIRELKKQPRYVSVPVVMITSDFDGYKMNEAKKAGVHQWIPKPFIRQQLVDTVRKFAAWIPSSS
jgi:two-component system chemotaxis response regulator CheY